DGALANVQKLSLDGLQVAGSGMAVVGPIMLPRLSLVVKKPVTSTMEPASPARAGALATGTNPAAAATMSTPPFIVVPPMRNRAQERANPSIRQAARRVKGH